MIDRSINLFFLEGVYIHLSIRTHVYGESKREIYFKELAHAIVDRLANPKSAGSLAEARWQHFIAKTQVDITL